MPVMCFLQDGLTAPKNTSRNLCFGLICISIPTLHPLMSRVFFPSPTLQSAFDDPTTVPPSWSALLLSRSSRLSSRRNVRSSYLRAVHDIMRPDARFSKTPNPVPSHEARVFQQNNFNRFLHTLESRFLATPEFTVNHQPHKESGLGNVIRGVMTTAFFASVTGRSFHSTASSLTFDPQSVRTPASTSLFSSRSQTWTVSSSLRSPFPRPATTS